MSDHVLVGDGGWPKDAGGNVAIRCIIRSLTDKLDAATARAERALTRSPTPARTRLLIRTPKLCRFWKRRPTAAGATARSPACSYACTKALHAKIADYRPSDTPTSMRKSPANLQSLLAQ
jgi:hypothetical protein